jgi:hypothetical protein
VGGSLIGGREVAVRGVVGSLIGGREVAVRAVVGSLIGGREVSEYVRNERLIVKRESRDIVHMIVRLPLFYPYLFTFATPINARNKLNKLCNAA